MPSLVIDMVARFAQFQDSLDKVRKDTGKTASDMSRAFDGVKTALGAIGLTLSAGAIVGGLKSLVTTAINSADELNKLSQKIGISVESLSRLSFAAELADVSQESLTVGVKKLSVTMFEAASGSKEAGAGFAALGINVKNSSGQLKSADQVIAEVADRFARIEDSAGKTALAVKLFGRSGQDMIPLLNLGSAGMKQLADEADRLGLTISGKTARAAEEFNDNLKRLHSGSRALGLTMAETLLPALSKLVEEFLRGKEAAGGLFNLMKANMQLNPLQSMGEQLTGLRNGLDELIAKRAELAKQPREGLLTQGDLARMDKEIEAQKKLLDILKARQLATVNRLDPGARDERARFGDVEKKEKAPLLADPNAGKAFDTALKSAEELLVKTQDLTRFQEVLKEIENGRYGKLDVAQKQQLLRLAALTDKAREDVALQKQVEDITTKGNQETVERLLKEGEARLKVAEALKDELDPLREMSRKLVEINDAVVSGALTDTEGIELSLQVYEKFGKVLDPIASKVDGVNSKLKDSADFSRDFGLIMESAFEKAVVAGDKLRDVLKGLLQDISKMVLRKGVTTPIGDAIGGLFKGTADGADSPAMAFFKKIGSSIMGPFATGTNFVPRTGLAMVHQGEQIIPAGQSGGGSTFNFNFAGGEPTNPRDFLAAVVPIMQSIADGAILKQQRNGGSLA